LRNASIASRGRLRQAGTRRMLEIAGAPAFTPARLQKRLAAMRVRNPGVTNLTATFAHFVGVDSALAGGGGQVLGRLLTYGPRATADGAPAAAARRLLVVPRLGTISPWSSKATDIARICGLARVRRIERGIWYAVTGEVADEKALRRALHDRMTESVLAPSDEAAGLVAEAAARPLAT